MARATTKGTKKGTKATAKAIKKGTKATAKQNPYLSWAEKTVSPTSKGQLERLDRLRQHGIEVPEFLTMTEASKLWQKYKYLIPEGIKTTAARRPTLPRSNFKPATETQIKYLSEHGIQFDEFMTSADAKEKIDAFKAHLPPATRPQLALLHALGVATDKPLSINEASNLIAEAKARKAPYSRERFVAAISVQQNPRSKTPKSSKKPRQTR